MALLSLPLLSTSCAKTSTLASIARTERPTLPKLSPELTRAERLTPHSGRKSGELVTVDKGWFGEALERYAEAVGAVERANNRAAGVKLERRCTAALFATGLAPADCPR
ncbi:hypothetical protein [Sphingomonas sp. S2-65]|uniref:hypothetical protein n=1 Tax=Sphingomonas sp. S2-65 TaxID=2903960 RepID=UPI001F22E32E|nr:hypothetical protein [Sphingomonas sp. S2-65]UYY60091.1 hypothetical protein LZ586_08445 [Sphingomonas sp. S2-65]